MIGLFDLILVFIFILAFWKVRFDYINPFFAFVAPWLAIFIISTFELSEFSRPINTNTYFIIIFIFIYTMCFNYRVSAVVASAKNLIHTHCNASALLALLGLWFILVVYLIASAGFIPLLRGVTTGDTGYFEFGQKGIYGMYNAYSNVLGLLGFYLYLKTNRKLFLIVPLVMLFSFVMFISRQNAISLLIECFVIYNFIKNRISTLKVFVYILIMLMGFAILGELRSGDIREISRIKEEFYFVPTILIWVYSYGYFNLLNFDNIINNTSAPYYDLSLFANFIPSPLRPEFMQDDYLEVSNFTVSSFAAPIYLDMGLIGIFLMTTLVLMISRYYFKHANLHRSFVNVAGYSVVFFCNFTAFFNNHWVYLPIIAQLFFVAVCGRFVLQEKYVSTVTD